MKEKEKRKKQTILDEQIGVESLSLIGADAKITHGAIESLAYWSGIELKRRTSRSHRELMPYEYRENGSICLRCSLIKKKKKKKRKVHKSPTLEEPLIVQKTPNKRPSFTLLPSISESLPDAKKTAPSKQSKSAAGGEKVRYQSDKPIYIPYLENGEKMPIYTNLPRLPQAKRSVAVMRQSNSMDTFSTTMPIRKLGRKKTSRKKRMRVIASSLSTKRRSSVTKKQGKKFLKNTTIAMRKKNKGGKKRKYYLESSSMISLSNNLQTTEIDLNLD